MKSTSGFDIEVELEDGARSFFGSDIKGDVSKLVLSVDIADLTNCNSAGDVGIRVNDGSLIDIENLDAVSVTSLDDVVTQINVAGSGNGFTASAVDGKLVITSGNTDSLEIFISATADTNATIFGDDVAVGGSLFVDENGVATANNMTASSTRGEITMVSDTGSDIIIDSDLGTDTLKEAALDKLGLVRQGGSSEAVGSGLSVGTVANANIAIDRIDDALNTISSNRGELGAVQNRLDSTISNLQNVMENFSAANARIVDVDFAVETVELTKAQILMQAGTAMLAQASQLPQNVLSLLG